MAMRRLPIVGLMPAANVAAASSPVRGIRTQIPPRPAVTVVTYLDFYGNPIRTKEETCLSLIRTRDNKFFLQRVMPDESIVRFAAPGLGMVKNAANFEYFSISEIDVYGGIVIPGDIMPIAAVERPPFHSAVHVMMSIKPVKKFTRKDRRAHHRKIYSHWEADPDKHRFSTVSNAVLAIIVIAVVCSKYYELTKVPDPLTPASAGPKREENSLFAYIENWPKRHPEHNNITSLSVDFTPGQVAYIQSRAESMDGDTDVTSGVEWVWKLRHAKTYGHWPKGIRE